MPGVSTALAGRFQCTHRDSASKLRALRPARVRLPRRGDTDDNETIEGQRYHVYDIVVCEPSLHSDFNIAYARPETGAAAVELEARISNVFNELPHTDTGRSFPYQRGRSVWLGLNYRY